MPGIPRIIPVRRRFSLLRLAVTLAAERVLDLGGHPARVLNRLARSGRVSGADRIDVRLAGAVAGFAAHSQLGGHDLHVRAQSQAARRMALEASHDLCFRIEGLVDDAGGIGIARFRLDRMARRQIQAARSRVETEAVLHIRVLIQLTDECDRLIARPKAPLDGNGLPPIATHDVNGEPAAGPDELIARIGATHDGRIPDPDRRESMCRYRPQCARMLARGLLFEPVSMAGPANLRAHVLGRASTPQARKY
jgi:hypothetical protein